MALAVAEGFCASIQASFDGLTVKLDNEMLALKWHAARDGVAGNGQCLMMWRGNGERPVVVIQPMEAAQ